MANFAYWLAAAALAALSFFLLRLGCVGFASLAAEVLEALEAASADVALLFFFDALVLDAGVAASVCAVVAAGDVQRSTT